jgi:hypothetical protein
MVTLTQPREASRAKNRGRAIHRVAFADTAKVHAHART